MTEKRKLDIRSFCSAPKRQAKGTEIIKGQVKQGPSDVQCQPIMMVPNILLGALDELDEDELGRFKFYLENPPNNIKKIPKGQIPPDKLQLVSKMIDFFGKNTALEVAVEILKKLPKLDLVKTITQKLQEESPSKIYSKKTEAITEEELVKIKNNHKCWLKNKYEFIEEETTVEKAKIPLNDIYTKVEITEGQRKVIMNAQEDLTARHSRQSFSEIFMDTEIRTVLTKGVAGIGKTISVQKFILDWAENKANQDVDFLFVLPFRELNLINETYSLHELVVQLHPKLKGCSSSLYNGQKIMFILDGLEESKISMKFRQHVVSDVDIKSEVDLLIINLINRQLLPSALIWITSRPLAADQIPFKCIDLVTEIEGFSDQQRKEYFSKRLKSKDQVDRILSHIKSTRILYMMCHIPVFCWISVTVLKPFLIKDCKEKIPTTLTEMYSHFLLIQMNMKNQKFDEKEETDSRKLLKSNREVILKLAKLAFKQLLMKNVIFYEEDLNECGIDPKDAIVHTGICTEVIKVESLFHRTKVFSFVHLSFQEFFAGLYVLNCYQCNENYEDIKMFCPKSKTPATISLESLLKGAVDKALKSENGHLDLFLRFLHGISLESNQRLLQGVLQPTQNNSEDSIKKSLKGLQKKHLNPERWMNLFLCLIEMKDNSLQQEVKTFLESKKKSKKLSLAHCSTMAYMLQASEKEIDELDLKKYNTSEEGRRRLIPGVSNCKKANLADCNLTVQSCENIVSALQSVNCPLVELDLSNNNLQDSGIELLSSGLKSLHCKLQILSLCSCKMTKVSCKDLASAIHSKQSFLKELNLSYNDLNDEGIKKLLCGKNVAYCKLEALRLSQCKITWKSCEYIAKALPKSQLKELDLSCNNLQDKGIQQLTAGLKESKINALRLSDCNLTETSCKGICSVLEKANSSMRNLDLSSNDLHDSGVHLLLKGLRSLEKLSLSGCCLTAKGTAKMASFVNGSSLENLDLSYNHIESDLAQTLFSKPALNLRLSESGRMRMAQGYKKYACKLTLEKNTANVQILLSEDNLRMTLVEQNQPYSPNKLRFLNVTQILCTENMSGRHYWEAEWEGVAVIAVAYKGISRKGQKNTSMFGHSNKSWSLKLSDQGCSVWHNKKCETKPKGLQISKRIGVLLDREAHTLSFYSISSNTHNPTTHIHTFQTTFTEQLLAGFGLEGINSTLTLCNLQID